MAVPASNNVTLELFFKMIEKENTKIPAVIPPINAKIEIGDKNLYEKISDVVKKPEIIAPKVAPAEIPIIPESANGFLKNPWKTAPLPPSKAPHKMHSKIRGNRISNRMIFSKRFTFPLKITDGEIFSAPKNKDAKIERMKMIIRNRICRKKDLRVKPEDDIVFLFI